MGKSLGYMTHRDIGNTGLFGLALYPLQVAADTVLRSSTTLTVLAVKP
jgi:hypothetical protein